jgi:tRNA (adenine37-N6)-methyltransferase
MSLVKLDRIEGSTIYFYGSDMVDGTPVIDIKPFIPTYDSPQKTLDVASKSTPSTPTNTMRSREEPEGEEEHDEDISQVIQPRQEMASPSNDVKVPEWVSSSNLLKVIFSENAMLQIHELSVNKKSIEEILENDPRSVYVREKYLSQIYNFQVDGNNVICKFDDKLRTVTVLQIRKLQSMNE